MSWIGIGQGESITGANIFIMYANTAGDNVTLAPRIGVGHLQQAVESTADITLLEGSGISNGLMTANFRCSNCNIWDGGSMSFKIWNRNGPGAYRSGQAVSFDRLDVRLAQHNANGEMTLNLQSADSGSDVNPFLGTTAAVNASSRSISGSSPTELSVLSNFNSILIAHGITGPIAFVQFFPFGAIYIAFSTSKASYGFAPVGWYLHI